MSIHDIGVALQAYLRTQGCPVTIVDGPEPAKTATWGRERIVIEHDPDGKASFGPPRGLHVNARHRRTATDSYKLTIYVSSRVSGAQPFEHRTRAVNVRETVMAGLDYVAAVNKNAWKPLSGGFITPPDLVDTERPGGAVYELKFTYDLPIRVVTFVGEAGPEATLGASGIRSTTKVSRAHGPDDDSDPYTVPASAETSCGA